MRSGGLGGLGQVGKEDNTNYDKVRLPCEWLGNELAVNRVLLYLFNLTS